MRKHSSSKSNARITAVHAANAATRAFRPTAFGTVHSLAFALALLLALAVAPAQPARAQSTEDSGTAIGNTTVLWNDDLTASSGSGVWDIASQNWLASDNATGTTFTHGDAVVFGASGTSAGGLIIIDSYFSGTMGTEWAIYVGSTVTIGPQAYDGPGHTANGINPGIIIASGSWEFDGGQFVSGSGATSGIAITGNSTVQFDRNSTFSKQHIDIADGVDFTLTTSPTMTTSMTSGLIGSQVSLTFTNPNFSSATDAVSAITAGAGASLTIALTGTETSASYTFNQNRTTAATAGAAINAGGNVTLTGTNLSVYFVNNQTVDTTVAANAYASAIYSTGALTVNNGATLRGEGGFAAQQFDINSATLAPVNNDQSRQQGIITLTVLDAGGAPVSATGADGKITFTDVTLYGYGGQLATYLGSEINLANDLKIDTSSAPAAGQLPNTMTISAPLTGEGGLDVYGGNTIVLTSTANTYTGLNTIEAGTLVGNITDNTGTLNIQATGVYRSGSAWQTTITTATTTDPDTGASTITTSTNTTRTPYATHRAIAELNGAGLLDMSGNDLDLGGGDFSTGTLANVATLTKINPDTNLSLAGGAVATLNINEGSITLGFGQQLTVTGTATIADTGTFNITLSNNAALNAQTLVTNGANINISGFGSLTQEPSVSQTNALVATTDLITRDYIITFQGTPLDDLLPSQDRFLDLKEDKTDPNKIQVTTSLVWFNTHPDQAHGTFDIPNGTVTINADLANNDNVLAAIAAGDPTYANWDGATLTKKGAGTLILNGANTYTGDTNLEEGLLINNNLISSTNINIDATGTLVNYGAITGQINNNAGYLYTTSTATIGDIVNNSGTIQFYINNINAIQTSETTTYVTDTTADSGTTATTSTSFSIDPYTYTYAGNLGGDGGLIIKSGNQTLLLTGSNTSTADIYIVSGTLASGRPHNLDSAASYTLDNQPDTTDTTGTISGYGNATLDLGGYDQNLNKLTFTDNGGILNFGPIITNPAGATYATATIGTMTTGSGINTINMRTDYGANKGDKIVVTNAITGTYNLVISNTDSVKPTKFNAIPLIVTPPGTSDANLVTSATEATLVITGSAESGIGILMIHPGDKDSTLFPDPDTWYLARTNKLSNTADAIFATISVNGLEWLYQLDLVRQRMGDLRQETLMHPPSKKLSPLTYTTVTSNGGNGWLRANAYHLDATDKITGEQFNQNVYNVAFGLDKTYRWEQHQYLLGGFAGAGAVNRDFGARGDGKTNNINLGLYFTYLNDNGWYGDTVLKLSRDRNSFTANAIDSFVNTGDYGALSWGLNVEVGRIMKDKTTGWWYEPSGQLAFIRFNSTDYTTSNGIGVGISSGAFQQYRAGIRAGHDIPKTPLKPYARLGLTYIAGDSPTVNIDNMNFSPVLHGFRLEAGAGLSCVIDDKSQLYLDYEYAKAQSYTRPWSINFGYRHTW